MNFENAYVVVKQTTVAGWILPVDCIYDLWTKCETIKIV